MISDIKFSPLDESFSIWLRSPKVASRLGDIVEVWKVQENMDLDPVSALKAFLIRRKKVTGEDPDTPAFVHIDGSIYTKAEFNRDLKDYLSLHPEITSSSLDSWTGHSFRSGLASLLQKLGFDDDAIKSWGRWKSNSYLIYMKDLEARKATRSRLTTTFKSILAHM